MHRFTIIIFVVLSSCHPFDGFDKDYYENVSGIKFPDQYNVVGSFDNYEFMSITVLDIQKEDCMKMIHGYNFQIPEYDCETMLYGLNNLKPDLLPLPNKESLLVRSVGHTYGHTGWLYVLDTTACRLYCQIDYPDPAGN